MTKGRVVTSVQFLFSVKSKYTGGPGGGRHFCKTFWRHKGMTIQKCTVITTNRPAVGEGRYKRSPWRRGRKEA